MTTIVLVALLVDVAEEDPNVVGISVVILASVVFATEGVKVLCSVVTGKVGTLVLSAVVPCTTGVDSESVVDCSDVSESVVDPSDVSESLVDWTVLLELVIVEVIPTVVPLEE